MRSLVAFFVASILYSHIYLYLYNENHISIMPGYSFIALVVLGVVSYIYYIFRSNRKNYKLNFAQQSNQKKLLYWFIIYSIAITLSFVFSDSNEHTLRAFKTFIVLSTLFITFFITFNDTSTLKAGVFGIVFVVLLSVAINYIDFILSNNTVFSKSAGRAAGFYVNPNTSGLKLVTGMILSVSILPKRLRIAYCLLVGSAVILTFSRSSTLAWLISFFGLSYLKIFNINRVITVSFSVLLVIILALIQSGQLSINKNLTGNLSEEASQRIVFKSDDYSANARLYSAKRALELYLKSPMFGHGLGSHLAAGTQVNPHNQYLILAVEQGTIGVLLYIALLLVIWQTESGIGRVFVVCIGLISFFDHNILDFPSTWLSIFLVALTINRTRKIILYPQVKYNSSANILKSRLRKTL